MEKHENLSLKRAKELEEHGSFWEAGEKYKDVLLALNKRKGSETEKALCKKKIREMNLKRANDFKEVTAECKLSEKQVESLKALINSFTEKELLSDSLELIGKDLNFHPKYSRVMKKAKEDMPITFMIASLSSQDSQGNFQRDGHDGFEMAYALFYDIDQGQIIALYLIRIMQKLMETTMDFENLSKYFKSTNLFSQNMLNTFDVGIERFLAHDYVSSMHILSPIFEKTFIDLTDAIGGADIVAARNQSGSSDQVWTQDRTLGEDFLKNEKVREIWGEDFCEQINFVMFAPLGYKLRHKIAHGNAAFAEYNFANNILILYFFLVMAARVKRNEKNVK